MQNPESFRRSFGFLGVGFMLGALSFMLLHLALGWWRDSVLSPLFDIVPGSSWADVRTQFGEPEETYTDLEEVLKVFSGYNHLCREHDLIVPGGWGSWDSDANYYSRGQSELGQLPAIDGAVALYHLSLLDRLLIYIDSNTRVERVILCST